MVKIPVKVFSHDPLCATILQMAACLPPHIAYKAFCDLFSSHSSAIIPHNSRGKKLDTQRKQKYVQKVGCLSRNKLDITSRIYFCPLEVRRRHHSFTFLCFLGQRHHHNNNQREGTWHCEIKQQLLSPLTRSLISLSN